VNGGRNYNGPKVNDSLALVKSGYMLESLSIPRYVIARSRENARVQTISRKGQQEEANFAREARGLWKGTTLVVP
jgi:hypothetical protein